MAQAQVRAFYHAQKKPRLRKSARLNPTIKFFDVERLLRPIDNEEGREEAASRVNYDESEDEDDVDLKSKNNGQIPPPPSAVLPIDHDDDVDLSSEELTEILADGPTSRVKKSNETEGAAIGKDTVDEEEDGGAFELTNWM